MRQKEHQIEIVCKVDGMVGKMNQSNPGLIWLLWGLTLPAGPSQWGRLYIFIPPPATECKFHRRAIQLETISSSVA